jgi:3-isopropylmalate/(R)-2-methylmalate dehydratase large subunit
MTLCNMATELGAFSAIIAPDEKTFSYIRGRPYAPAPAVWDQALASWKALVSDDDAQFDVEHRFDAADVARMVTWGTNPQQAVPLRDGLVPATPTNDETNVARERARDYMDVEQNQAVAGLRIDAAFIGSCTNARLPDLRRAAAVLAGRKVAPHVRAICVPGSTRVKAEAEAEGLDRIFLAAGFEWREAGCSMCFFAGGESFGRRQRVISSTNRNFESRQGPETRTHLASPEVVAASAVAGRIASPEML